MVLDNIAATADPAAAMVNTLPQYRAIGRASGTWSHARHQRIATMASATEKPAKKVPGRPSIASCDAMAIVPTANIFASTRARCRKSSTSNRFA